MTKALKRILIVDDEQDLVDVLAHTLESDSLTVDKSYSGEDALQKIKRNDYDVIVTDLKMPGMSGMELLRKIREDFGDRIKVFVLSGFADHTEQNVLAAGATGFFTKPEGLKELVKSIQQLFDN